MNSFLQNKISQQFYLQILEHLHQCIIDETKSLAGQVDFAP